MNVLRIAAVMFLMPLGMILFLGMLVGLGLVWLGMVCLDGFERLIPEDCL